MRADEYAIRFHLHPAVKASRLSDGHGVILLLPDKELWTFNTFGDPVELEESVFLASPDGPRRAVQIVIYGKAREKPAVRWCLHHSPPAAHGAPRQAERGAGIAAVSCGCRAGAAAIHSPPVSCASR